MPLPAQRPTPTRPRPPTPARDLGPSPALGSTQTKQLQAQVRKVLPPGRTLQSYGLSLLTKDPKVSTGGRKPRIAFCGDCPALTAYPSVSNWLK